MIDVVTAFALLVPQDPEAILIIKFCKDVEPWSIEWLAKMCFMYTSGTSQALHVGLSAVGALLSAAALRWFVAGR